MGDVDAEQDYAERIQEVLQEVRNQATGGVVTRWVVLAEFMDEEGERALEVMRGPSTEAIPIWDVKGMLFEILHDPNIFDADEEDEP